MKHRALAAALCGAIIGCASVSSAAVVCQHPKRQKQLRLEPGAECAKKGWVKVADLGKFVVATDLTPLTDLLTAELGLACVGDGSRELALRLPGAPDDGCRRYDDDAARCATAFQSTPTGAAACFHFRGRCYPCAGELESVTACTNTCQPPSCPGAPSRTYVGSNCYGLDEARCTASYIQNRRNSMVKALDATPATAEATTGSQPVSCYWNGDYCTNCAIYFENQGTCTNACVEAPGCGLRTQASCGGAASADACGQRYQVSEATGLAVSCAWSGSACEVCDEDAEFRLKRCTNTCS